ncbi:MAG TPA: RNA polymerase subunit sigma-24 [Verrucomicrobia bacterium]|jgi:RNA polymerase sigma-70 factor (ECF subfamily)|nr:RNA polymerase subunit sigma-24 [Verrucomicrobiota bacterium]
MMGLPLACSLERQGDRRAARVFRREARLLGLGAIMSEELFRKAQSGDLEAFEELVGAYKEPILNYVYRLVGNYHDAEELAQEAFVRLYRSLGSIKMEGHTKAWLYRVAGNLAKDRLRYWKRRQGVHVELLRPDDEKDETGRLECVAPAADQPDRQTIGAEFERCLQDAIMELPIKLRRVLILRDIEGLSGREVGQLLNCQENAVHVRLNRAHKRLRDILQRRYHSEKSWTSET